jgi:hypothetical protein
MPIERTCKSCGATFYVKPTVVARGSGNYCSWECRKKQITRLCETCGQPFIAKNCLVAIGKARYCSKKCSPTGTFKQVSRICEVCGTPFTAKPSAVRNGKGRYCSNECNGIGIRGPRTPIGERFWSKVNRSGGPDVCWPWLGRPNTWGYGTFVIRLGVRILAHRMAYELTYGKIPDGLFGTHECDNPICCNPKHITPGTSKKNSYDILLHTGKWPRETFSDEDVRSIRMSTRTLQSVAQQYSTSKSTVSRIRHRKVYSRIPD